MKYNTYSILAETIREKIGNPVKDISEIINLIKQSFDFLSIQPSETSIMLHNKLIEMLHNQHPIHEFKDLHEVYFLLTKRAEDLEYQFSLDPSKFSVVFQLAVEYAALGKHKRAKQLLSRIARSEYCEKEQATTFLKEKYGEEY